MAACRPTRRRCPTSTAPAASHSVSIIRRTNSGPATTKRTSIRKGQTMRAVHMSRHGGLDVLDLWDVPAPQAGAGQVLVRIKFAGLNFADVCMREGDPFFPLPFVPGLEGSGVVDAVGPGVKTIKAGDRVAFVTWRCGAHADLVAVDEAAIVPLPDDISFEQGAAVILQGLTAHYLVSEIHKVMPGDAVLVHAAAGGKGLLLVQWLKH